VGRTLKIQFSYMIKEIMHYETSVWITIGGYRTRLSRRRSRHDNRHRGVFGGSGGI